MRTCMKGPKTFEEWVKIGEERSGGKYTLSPGEQVVWHTMYGFFSFWYDAENRELIIPKMCGDGRHWRKLIYEMARAAGPELCRGVSCCTKRNPMAYMRILGGKLRRVEHSFDFETKKHETLWFIFITWNDTKEGRH